MQRWFIIVILFISMPCLNAQDTLTVMTYNLLNYGNFTDYCTQANNDPDDKTEWMKEVIDYIVPDVLAVNQSKRIFSDLVTMLFPKDMIQVVANQYQKGHPVSPEIIAKQIGKPVFSIIPKDDQTLISALSKSQPAITIASSSAFSINSRALT